MKGYTFPIFCLLFIFMTETPVQINAESILNWFWSKQETPALITDGVPLISIPYELLTEDEKFLKEAAKLVTDIQIASPLEVCQHKVVMQIKTSCSSMSEEQLAKLSVNLLNCQSTTEGRRVFPCTDNMSIKQCTKDMDPDTWNSYLLMSNRARAVCYASRSHQFRALTELTINKLMESAHKQINTLSSLKDSQDRLEEQTVTAQQMISSNIQDLTDEKALIRAGHAQLASMAEDIQKRLEKASEDLSEQAAERSENHQEIIQDLENIKIQAQVLWEKIESSTDRIVEQNRKAATQYEETLKKLEKVNETIVFIWDLTNNMRNEIDKKLGWISEYIGTAGENLEKIYYISVHVVYLLAAMLAASFLDAPVLTRSAIMGMVPLNLASYLKHGLNACLDFVSLTMLILLITAMHYVMNGIQYMLRSRNNSIEKTRKHHETSFTDGGTVLNGHANVKNHVTRQTQELSLVSKVLHSISNLGKTINQKVFQSIANLQSVYSSMKSWVWQKFVPTEELSCSYVPSRKYDHLISKGYVSISDDSSEYNDSHEHPKYVLSDDHSVTGAVLRRKFTVGNPSPLTEFSKGNSEPMIRETIHIRKRKELSPTRVTPISRALCGARTRSGNPCRLLASRGQNFCHRHSSGSSTMSD